jgi:hypothetical protein
MLTCQSIFQVGRWGINRLQREVQIARSSAAPRAAYPSASAAPNGGSVSAFDVTISGIG